MEEILKQINDIMSIVEEQDGLINNVSKRTDINFKLYDNVSNTLKIIKEILELQSSEIIILKSKLLELENGQRN